MSTFHCCNEKKKMTSQQSEIVKPRLSPTIRNWFNFFHNVCVFFNQMISVHFSSPIQTIAAVSKPHVSIDSRKRISSFRKLHISPKGLFPRRFWGQTFRRTMTKQIFNNRFRIERSYVEKQSYSSWLLFRKSMILQDFPVFHWVFYDLCLGKHVFYRVSYGWR